jgi:hypothetical protein
MKIGEEGGHSGGGGQKLGWVLRDVECLVSTINSDGAAERIPAVIYELHEVFDEILERVGPRITKQYTTYRTLPLRAWKLL